MKRFRRAAIFAAVLLFAVIALDRGYVTPVLVYHHVDSRAGEWKLSVLPESFARQMEFLRAHRYRVLPLARYVRMLKEGGRVPRKSVVITFDDGYDDNLTNAFPVLRKMNFPATIFMQVDAIGREGYLNAEDLGILVENGVDIGSHTLSHAFLPELDTAGMKREIEESKLRLEEVLEGPVMLFAYPGGGLNVEAYRLVQAAGFEGACATHAGVDANHRDPYALRRIRISRTCDNLIVFWFKLSGFYTYIEEWRG